MWQRLIRWIKGGGWYYVVPIASAGLLAAVPFGHAAHRLKRSSLWQQTVAFGVVGLVLLGASGLLPTNELGEPDGAVAGFLNGVLVLSGLAFAAFACWRLRPVLADVRAAPSRGTLQDRFGFDPAVQAALSARHKRDYSRALAQQDPLLATDLGIGRPDLRRSYDDGGLVDLNLAPFQAICDRLGDRELAIRIVRTREERGCAFLTVDDACHVADIPVDQRPLVRDRGWVRPIS